MESFNDEKLKQYFPSISEVQLNKFSELFPLYSLWNKRINLISQKDISNLFIRHILHSLAIAKVIKFPKGSKIVDVGSGGGFPGIPLAVLFPESQFTLIDSIGKKVKVIKEISQSVKLTNVNALQKRSNEFKETFDFVTGRAVTAFPKFYDSVIHLINKNRKLKNRGILYLKVGNFEDEIKQFRNVKVYNIHDFFEDEFFETKKVIYLPVVLN